MTSTDYWEECIADAADECGLSMSKEQLLLIAKAVEGAHENYGMAFYSPPDGDRIAGVDREWKRKYDALQAEFDKYRNNANTAVRQALGQHHDTPVSIGEHGEVTRHGGRSERIQ